MYVLVIYTSSSISRKPRENPANHFTTWREPNGHPSIAGTGQASLDPEVDVISRPPPQNNRVTRWLGAGFKTPKPGLASGKSGRGLHKEREDTQFSVLLNYRISVFTTIINFGLC